MSTESKAFLLHLIMTQKDIGQQFGMKTGFHISYLDILNEINKRSWEDKKMSFTITCDACGQKQLLTQEAYYDQDKISLEVDGFVEHWDALSIECKTCKQEITK